MLRAGARGTWTGFLHGLEMLWWAVREEHSLEPQHVTEDGSRPMCGKTIPPTTCVLAVESAAQVVWWCKSCKLALRRRLSRDWDLQTRIGLNADCGVGKRWTNSDTTLEYTGGRHRVTAVEHVDGGFVVLEIVDAPSPNVDDRVVQLGRFRTEREASRHHARVWAKWDHEDDLRSRGESATDGFNSYDHT